MCLLGSELCFIFKGFTPVGLIRMSLLYTSTLNEHEQVNKRSNMDSNNTFVVV